MPGASPEIMASSVATPLERSLGTIAGVNTMSSHRAQAQFDPHHLQFDMDRDINGAAREVQAAINASRNLLPSRACAACRRTRRSIRPRRRSWCCR
jgi:multidrug efflux pump